jgi:uncharacterized membrane protein YdjX (TVP38/TMEM64 family)
VLQDARVNYASQMMEAITPDQDRSPERPEHSAPPSRTRGLWKWLLGAAIMGGLLALGRQLPVDSWIEASRGTIEGLGVWGPVAFGIAYVSATVLMVPGILLTIAAGALFGPLLGTATVSVSSVTGSAIAFLIARHLARERVEKRLQGNPRFAAIDRAIGEQGWKIVGLLRLSPAMPFSLSNYLYGLTAVAFWPYVGVSAVAMLPATFLYVYLGDIGAKGVEAAVGAETASASGLEWSLRIIGLLASVGVTIYVTRIARRAIAQQTQIDQIDETEATPAGTDTPE